MANQSWIKQMEHAQTKSYYDSLGLVLQAILGGMERADVLELGLDWGISARVFLEHQKVKRLVSVDVNHRPEVDDILAETTRASIFEFVQMKTDAYFALPLKDMFDLIYIDADHTHEQVKVDLENAWSRLKLNGWIVMHDVLHKGHFDGRPDAYGVLRAMAEFVAEHELEAFIVSPYPGIVYFRKS